MAKVLKEAGGLESFKRALAGLLLDDFLMGRVPPRDGGEPFSVDIEWFLRKGLGRCLSKAPGEGSTSCEATVELPDGRTGFESRAVVRRIGTVTVRGEEANAILMTVPEATAEMVVEALAEVPRNASSIKDIKDVVMGATRRVERLALFAKHGRPEEFCSGPVAVMDGREMRTDLVCLSQQWLNGAMERYPEAQRVIVWHPTHYHEPAHGGQLIAKLFELQYRPSTIKVEEPGGYLVCVPAYNPIDLYPNGGFQKRVEEELEAFFARLNELGSREHAWAVRRRTATG